LNTPTASTLSTASSTSESPAAATPSASILGAPLDRIAVAHPAARKAVSVSFASG